MSCRNIHIRIYKTSCIRVIISTLEIVKSCFGVEIVASIADWVNFTDAGGVIGYVAFAPSVVEVFSNNIPVFVKNRCYIALEIFAIEIIISRIYAAGKDIISKATDARSIIEIDKACTVSAFLYQLIAIIKIIYAILSATLSKTVIRKGIIIKGFELSNSIPMKLYHNSTILSIK